MRPRATFRRYLGAGTLGFADDHWAPGYGLRRTTQTRMHEAPIASAPTPGRAVGHHAEVTATRCLHTRCDRLPGAEQSLCVPVASKEPSAVPARAVLSGMGPQGEDCAARGHHRAAKAPGAGRTCRGAAASVRPASHTFPSIWPVGGSGAAPGWRACTTVASTRPASLLGPSSTDPTPLAGRPRLHQLGDPAMARRCHDDRSDDLGRPEVHP